MRRWLSPLVLFSLAATLLVGAPQAGADVSKGDGNDTKGFFDLRSVSAHYAKKYVTFRVETQDAFRGSKLDPDRGWIEIDLDTNANQKFDYYLIGYWYMGLQGVLIRRDGTVETRKINVTHPEPTVLQLRVKVVEFTNFGSYDFAAFGVSFTRPCTSKDPCVDGVPNRFPLLRHDFGPPIVKILSFDEVASDTRADGTLAVTFTAKDNRYGTGVRRWTVQARPSGGTSWIDVVSGSTVPPEVDVALDPGKWDLRVRAVDRQGNIGGSTIVPGSMPWDDADPAIVYGGTWAANTSVTDAFLGTTHVGQTGATLTFEVTGHTSICVLGGPTSGGVALASVTLNGQSAQGLSEGSSTPARTSLACWSLAPSLTTTMVLTVTSAEPLAIDGVYVM